MKPTSPALPLALMLVSLLAGCNRSDSDSAAATDNTTTTSALADSYVLHNITGYTPTADGGTQRFSALWVENGRIKAVGDAALKDQLPAAQQRDGGGKFVLPGLIDAHGHVLGLGIEQMQVDLRGTQTLDEALQRVRDFAAKHPDAPWIEGRGWNQVLWPGKAFPTASDLDRAVADRPVFLSRVDGHAGWANSKALQLAGIDQQTADPVGGQILRNEKGEASGVFIDMAMGLIEQHIPGMDDARRREALSVAMQKLAAQGITGVHDAGVGRAEFAQYETLAKSGAMPIRIYAMASGGEKDARDWLKEGPKADLYNDFLSLRSVKLYADGALGSRGAALHADYSDQHGNKGLFIIPPKDLTDYVHYAATLGWQVNVHAIGDAANTLVLDSFAALQAPNDAHTKRHRVEHAQVVALNDIPRFKQLGVIASMQPTHATSDMNMAEARVGAERIKGAYAWHTFREHGVVIAAGSDFPVELSSPFLGLYAAVTREDSAGQPPGGWYPNEKLTREEALRAFTLDAAYAAHQEQKLGSLEAGKWADYIVVDRDYFQIPQAEIDDIKVLETVVGGKTVTGGNSGAGSATVP